MITQKSWLLSRLQNFEDIRLVVTVSGYTLPPVPISSTHLAEVVTHCWLIYFLHLILLGKREQSVNCLSGWLDVCLLQLPLCLRPSPCQLNIMLNCSHPAHMVFKFKFVCCYFHTRLLSYFSIKICYYFRHVPCFDGYLLALAAQKKRIWKEKQN